MMTPQECRAYRTKVLNAKSDAERVALRDVLHKTLATRAQTGPDNRRGLAMSAAGTSK
jgi:hypothetical protein